MSDIIDEIDRRCVHIADKRATHRIETRSTDCLTYEVGRMVCDSWPAIRDRLREAERKAEAFDAIANGNVVFEFDLGFRKYAARTNASCNFWSVDLLTAIESALRGQKETT